MTQQNSIQVVIARAMKDEAFRQQLKANPKAVLERELGLTLPQGATVQVYEDTATTYHLVIPTKLQVPAGRELTDEELEAVAGGLGWWTQGYGLGGTGCGPCRE